MNDRNRGRRDQGGRPPQSPQIRMYVFLKPENIVETSTKDVFDVTLEAGHNHFNSDTDIPAKVFLQGKPIGLENVKGKTTFTFKGIKLDRSQPVKARIERAGYPGEGDDMEVSWDQIKPKPKTKTTTTDDKGLADLEVLPNFPRPDPGNRGYFLISVLTRLDGKETTRRFRILSNLQVTIYRRDVTGLTELDPLNLETVGGAIQLLINFEGSQAKLDFTLVDDRATVVVRLVR